MSSPSQSKVRVSVIVPAHACAAQLEDTLGALMRSDLPRQAWQLIVVDDASPDNTPFVASRYADVLVRLPDRARGPAYARNRGAEVACGDLLLFLDADVRTRPDTLRALVEVLDCQPHVTAVFGSYDATPEAPGLVSQFRNLLHHWVHQQNPGESQTFWAGCGAVRRSAFLDAGMFNEWHYSQPQIEDIEFGYRLHERGRRIALHPEVQVTHLKRWTFWGMLRTDLKSRGIPWMWLLLQRGGMESAGVLNVRMSERISTALACTGALALFVGLLLSQPAWGAALWLFSWAGVAGQHWGFYRFLRAERGSLFALGSIGAALPLLLAERRLRARRLELVSPLRGAVRADPRGLVR